MTASGSLAGSETPDQQWLGTLPLANVLATLHYAAQFIANRSEGDDKLVATANVLDGIARFLPNALLAAAPSVESGPAPTSPNSGASSSSSGVAPVSGIDVEATQKLLLACERQEIDYAETCESALQEFPDDPDFTRDAMQARARAATLRTLADALPSLVSGQADTGRLERHTPDEIRAINQAAANLDGVLALSSAERHGVAMQLFAIAGNPMPPDVVAVLNVARVVPQEGGR
jgi:hypothetical protein